MTCFALYIFFYVLNKIQETQEGKLSYYSTGQIMWIYLRDLLLNI